jgi:hypothetical protein
MKQTAVEWLVERIKLDSKSQENSNGGISFTIGLSKIDEIFNQAKEMEKEQKIAFGKKCYHPLTERKHTSDVHFECTICGDNNY